MSATVFSLLGVTLTLAVLIGLLILAVVRLRRGTRNEVARSKVSEEAFMATTIQQALVDRDRLGASRSAPHAATPASSTSTLDADIVEHLPVAMLVLDESRRVLRVNAAARGLLGVKQPPSRGATIREALAAQPTVAQVLDVPRPLSHASASRIDLPDDNDGWRTIEIASTPFGLSRERRVLVSFRDVSADEQREQLSRRRETMAEVGRIGSSLSHELANSLTAVHGYSRMIDPVSLNENDRMALEAIQKEADTLGVSLEAFRRVTRPLALYRESFQVRWAVDDAAKHVSATLDIPTYSVMLRVPDALEVSADRVLLEEALIHILTNAVEACREAAIVPAVGVTASTSLDGSTLTIAVSDNGPGVPIEERDRLLDLFSSTRSGHVGAGLSRTRHIVHSHDGSLTFEHPSTGGLLVWIALPIANSADSPSERR